MKLKKMKTSESISQFLSFLRELSTEFNTYYEDVNRYDKETQDLLHEIELGSCKSRPKFATALSHVRQKRRQSKNFVDINQEVVTYIQTPEFIKVQRKLEQLLGTVRKQENYIENTRTYNAKVREDLTILQNEEK